MRRRARRRSAIGGVTISSQVPASRKQRNDMKRHQIAMLAKATVAVVALLAFPTHGLSEWRVDKPGIATLGEVGGRATLFIQCSRQGADPGLYLHQPAGETHVVLTYRFDDNAPEMRKVPVSGAGHVLKIWNDDEK